MTIASEIQRIKTNISNAYTACDGKGATMPTTQNSANLATCIDSLQSGGGIPYVLPDLNYIVRTNYSVENVKKGSNILSYTETNLNTSAFAETYKNDTTILALILNGITTISAQYLSPPYALYSVCSGATNLKYVYFKNLQTISGSGSSATQQLGWAFQSTSIEEISFDSLNDISITSDNYGIFQFMVQYCTKIKNIYFRALNSNSFGSHTHQFDSMLSGVTGCTVHFPSNLQSVIGNWSSVTSGFGGTNTTVLFDLSATT